MNATLTITMNDLTIFETEFWKVTHRKDSRFPGYLMASSKSKSSSISDLCTGTLTEMGSVLAKVESLLISSYHPFRVITAKMGFSAGYSCHFHIIPVTQQLLEEVIANPRYSKDPDGNDVLLFTSREYCERDLSLEEHSLQIKAVEYLRGELTRCST